MPVLRFRTPLPVPREALYRWHARAGALERLLPPWERAALERWEGGEATAHLPPDQQVGDISAGATVTVRARVGPLSPRVVARHSAHAAGEGFTDEMLAGPFASWRHDHRFLADETGSVLEDEIHYELPFGALGSAAAGAAVRRRLERMFAFRHRRTEQDLARHQAFADKPRLKVAITGASGLLGGQLVPFLRTGGHTVLSLVRRAPAPGADEVRWDPAKGEVDAASLEGVDAVLHLAGEPVAGLWTAEKKRRILESREQGTAALARALAGMTRPPARLLSASAIGYYGYRLDAPVDESGPKGEGFLADVCAAWESAADPAREAGIRVIHPRIGVALSAAGGALGAMLPAFRMGVGGRLGRGDTWMSWIAAEDTLGALHWLLWADLAGPVNITAPEPVTNAEFTKTLGKVLGRPTILPVPAAAMRLLPGGMGEETLLSSARVLPKKLLDSGFSFLYPGLEGALRAELGA